MSTSELACAICGESPDVCRIDWGCVVCNPDKERQARLPEVPVSTGPADRADGVGCLQHGIVGCERCIKLEFRHRAEIDPSWKRHDDGSWRPEAPVRGGAFTLLALALAFIIVVGGCFAVVWTYWPR
jgi:hypothetical protein